MDRLHALLFTARRSVRPHLVAASRRAVFYVLFVANFSLRSIEKVFSHIERKAHKEKTVKTFVVFIPVHPCATKRALISKEVFFFKTVT